jgi:2Fe-2S ferredoxin
MPRVVFEAPDVQPLTVDAPDGGALCDLIDTKNAPVPFSCRSASCGTCRIVILEGAGELLTPEDEELDLLEVFGATPDKQRLACQAKMKKGLGLLRVRPVTESE